MKKKGFATSAILYTLLILFLVLLIEILNNLQGKYTILQSLKTKVKEELETYEQHQTYAVYLDGTAVYYNPETNQKCESKNVVSTPGTKSGCMKWYVFNDGGELSSTVNMILDHNTTAYSIWNSSGSNSEMKEVAVTLQNDTKSWSEEIKPTVRLITANEVAKITGNDTFDQDVSTYDKWFYFDSNSQTKVATTKGASHYAWLYDYTLDCTSFGCNIASSSTGGYWTSTPIVNSNRAWRIDRDGRLCWGDVNNNNGRGIRPVITILKSII